MAVWEVSLKRPPGQSCAPHLASWGSQSSPHAGRADPCGVSPGRAPVAAFPGTSSRRRRQRTLRLFTCSAAPRGEAEAPVAEKLAEGIHWTVELGSPPAPAVGPCGEHGGASGHASAPGGGADRGGRPCCPVGGSLQGQAGAPGGAFRGPPSCPHLSCQGSQPLPWGRSCYETGWGPTGLPEQEGGTEAGGVRPGRALRPRGLGLGLGRGQGPLRGRGVPCGVLGRQASMGRPLSPAPTELRPPQLSGGGSEPNRAEERGASHGLGKEAGGLVSEWEAHVTQVPTPRALGVTAAARSQPGSECVQSAEHACLCVCLCVSV